ncbi:MAG: RIP metalloprotease RseP [Candidatus Nitronauta litoralis]|uniref:Zinc metalloprotease n=1 Tax=Candidatus Nitronauta litoralis TaxID=2705533 RepID=A0A7T0BY89_9BACT|nr:MAG: RIP metalloprotease RseP [Candidatus Nitronauta litoralis]
MTELSLFPLDTLLDFGLRMGAFLAGLAALIFVHELGHFLVARRYGVIVEKFALGFGPKLVGFTKGGTEYLIAAIPLGGYVKMKGEDPNEELEDTTGSFHHAKVGHRIAIAFAGPLFNFIFAILIFAGVYIAGVPSLDTTVGNVKEDFPASAAGIKTGDRIVEINGKKIQYWEELLDIVHNSPGKKIDFMIDRSNTLIPLSITPVVDKVTDLLGDEKKVGLIGIGSLRNLITYVDKGSAADTAGLKVDDRLVAVDGVPIREIQDLVPTAIDKPGQELIFSVIRDGKQLDLPVTPEPKTIKDEKGLSVERGLIGLNLGGNMLQQSYSLPGAIIRSLEETWGMIKLIAISIQKMIFGSVPSNSIGGPILIFQVYGEQAQQGFMQTIRLTALLSINLGLINLLPIPILDGGHIFFFLIEILKGRPVSERNRERAAQVGLFMILSLMVFAFYNDIARIMN